MLGNSQVGRIPRLKPEVASCWEKGAPQVTPTPMALLQPAASVAVKPAKDRGAGARARLLTGKRVGIVMIEARKRVEEGRAEEDGMETMQYIQMHPPEDHMANLVPLAKEMM